jgi:mRNA-degrading endonuclease YafQ of YafQ-DinJ toxin-antitoxin module
MNIAWTPKSLRSFKRLIRKDPNLRPLIEQALLQLAEDPFCPSLRTHKLKGELANVWWEHPNNVISINTQAIA